MQFSCQNNNQREELRQDSGEVFPKMFMNAQPRRVAHGHETFVHFGRTEPSHQGLSEMTDNQVNLNAWGSHGPADSSSRSRYDNIWNDQKAGFVYQSENYQDIYTQNDCVQTPLCNFPYDRAPNFDQGIPAYSYATPLSRQDCSTSFCRQYIPAGLNQSENMQADDIAKLDLVLSNPNYQWPWTVANPSSSYFAEDQGFLLPCNTLSDSLSGSSCGVPSASPHRSRIPSHSENTPPSDLYSDYATSETLSQELFRAANETENIQQRMVWNENVEIGQHQNCMDNLLIGTCADGLQDYQPDSSWFSEDPLPPPSWFHQAHVPSTISPKDLALNTAVSVAPVKCPDILNMARKGSTTSVIKTIELQDSPDIPRSLKQRKRLPGGRLSEMLPDVPSVPSTSNTIEKVVKKVTTKRAKSPRIMSPVLKPTSMQLMSPQAPSKSFLPMRQAVTTPKKTSPKASAAAALSLPDNNLSPPKLDTTIILPKIPVADSKLSTSKSNEIPHLPISKPCLKKQSPAKTSGTPFISRLSKRSPQRQDSKDRFLVASKLAGMSYKEIRVAGNFSEAESTLRGRFRTLTKEKEKRVRRPAWQENDIRLLKKAVRKLTRHQERRGSGKISWKSAAEYIASNGGSYHFGNATCRKKWDELQMNGESKIL